MSEERPANRIFSMPPSNLPATDHSEQPQQVIYTNTLQAEAAQRIQSAERGELKAKLAAILDRSSTYDRFRIDLPPDVHGEWCRNDPNEIARMKTLGFEVDTQYATKRALHSNGDDAAVVGDVIHMIAPREVKELIDEIQFDERMKRHAKKRHKEELDYQRMVNKDTDGDIPAMIESVSEPATVDSVAAALREAVTQTQPIGQV